MTTVKNARNVTKLVFWNKRLANVTKEIVTLMQLRQPKNMVTVTKVYLQCRIPDQFCAMQTLYLLDHFGGVRWVLPWTHTGRATYYSNEKKIGTCRLNDSVEVSDWWSILAAESHFVQPMRYDQLFSDCVYYATDITHHRGSDARLPAQACHMHIMVFHVPKMLRVFGNIKQFSGQGK